MKGNTIIHARRCVEAGDLVAAHDQLQSLIDSGQTDEQVRFLFVLTLARMGATERAAAYYDSLQLCHIHSTDAKALWARLQKDMGFASKGTQRNKHLSRSAKAYQDIEEMTGDVFPAINAATLFLLTGAEETAREKATAILSRLSNQQSDDYYDYATCAEAHCILDDFAKMHEMLNVARNCPEATVAAMAGTATQLERVLHFKEVPKLNAQQLLAPLKTGHALHFCGRMFEADISHEELLSQEIYAFFDKMDIKAAFGSLACGSDILIAEALLERGIPLSIVLASPVENFLTSSVLIGGEEWRDRYYACLDNAHHVSIVGDPFHAEHPISFGLVSEVAMGMAASFAEQNNSDLHQLALTDNKSSGRPAGTDSDVSRWTELGRSTTKISTDHVRRLRPSNQQNAGNSVKFKRRCLSLLFADFAGFTKILDHQLPDFLSRVLETMAHLFSENASDIALSNTWGDACFAAFTDPITAARTALELPLRLKQQGLGEIGLDLRVSLHHGVVLELDDPVLGHPNIFGQEVARAARIEPVTPPGFVYASQQFVSVASNYPNTCLSFQYIGNVQLAKGYGTERLYLISKGRHVYDS